MSQSGALAMWIVAVVFVGAIAAHGVLSDMLVVERSFAADAAWGEYPETGLGGSGRRYQRMAGPCVAMEENGMPDVWRDETSCDLQGE